MAYMRVCVFMGVYVCVLQVSEHFPSKISDVRGEGDKRLRTTTDRLGSGSTYLDFGLTSFMYLCPLMKIRKRKSCVVRLAVLYVWFP